MSAFAVDALLFDVGGVLIDIDFQRCLQSWADAAGVPVATLAARFATGKVHDEHQNGQIDAPRFYASLREILGVGLSDAQLLAGWNAIFIGPIPGVADLLRQLPAGLPLYLFSNTNQPHYLYWGRVYPELLERIRQVFCSHELGLRKPAVESFQAVAALMGVAPGRIAFFDDALENVEGACLAGMRAFQVAGLAPLRQALAGDLGIPLTP